MYIIYLILLLLQSYDNITQSNQHYQQNSLIPSTVIGTSTAKKPKQDPALLRSAITALRFMLSHPLTSDNDHLHFNKPPQYCKLNFITRARQKKHVEPPKPTQKFTRRLKSQKEIDKILDTVYNDESDESDDERIYLYYNFINRRTESFVKTG